VIVIGAGIVGVSTAYELARRGARVTLLDRGPVGSGASFGNAGLIALGHLPLPRPGLATQAIRWMLNRGSPLYIPPRLDFSLFAWLLKFHRACTAAHVERCMHVLSSLARVSEACFDEIMSRENIDCGYSRAGWLEVVCTDTGLAHARSDAAVVRRFGFEVDEWSPADLRAREPAYSDAVRGAFHYRQSAFADPYRFVTGLAVAAARHGAAIREQAPVREVLLRDGRFHGVRLESGEVIAGDVAVLAAGIWSTALAKSIGIRIPMQAGKGYHINIPPPQPALGIAAVLAETFIAATPMSGILRLAGTMELSGINDRMVRRRLDMLLTGARRYLHGLDAATPVLSEWCGLRPCTADGLPVIGWSPSYAGVFIATGHAKMGFALGPATGRIACECILDNRAPMDLAGLLPSRFGPRRQPPARGLDLQNAARGPAHGLAPGPGMPTTRPRGPRVPTLDSAGRI
jgi:D-amino-acid dehydrogenase